MNLGQQQDEQDKDQASEKIILGRITGVYGVKGWLKVFSYTEPMQAIVDYSPWYIRAVSRESEHRDKRPWKEVKLEAGKRHAKTVIAKLEHCDDRDSAMSFVGTEIAIENRQLEELSGENEYYWRDLIGLRVINRQGIELGIVKSLMETGANDVLVVVSDIVPEEGTATETKERLIPWTLNNAIIAVDLETGIIQVDWDPDF
jgi:16S rRNA processing protein RimM